MTPSSARALSAQADLGEQPLLSEDIQLLRSCESCRRKKRKCSGDRPACTRCKAQGECCSYRPTARFLKPRPGGDPLAQRKTQHTKKKRASIAAASPLHRMYGSASPAHPARARAMSVVAAAAMRNAHRQPVAADPIAFAPIDLMFGPPLTGPPVGLSSGAMSASELAGAADSGLVVPSSTNGLAYMSTTTATPTASLSAFSLCDDESPSLVLPPAALDQQYLCPPGLAPSQPAALYDADYTRMLTSAITQQQAAAALMSAASMGATPLMCSPPLSNASLSTSSPLAADIAANGAMSYLPFSTQRHHQHHHQLGALTPWPAGPYADPAALLGGAAAAAGPAMMMASGIASMGYPPHALMVDGGDGRAAAAAASFTGALDAILPQSKTAFSEWFAQ
ncbi:hypothetical protein LPJ61_003132 [Coemansia biformis]|uniref:Zn(2)-C6 fungal-type domain-containing protein n=1 Tax=Coemansia biformis TaxID=1286918 RepID=A0A9W7YCQ7_9FUNG|nr:hypothetical protein LPJ61_003132 [Coemansia biformis]